jgi:cell division protein FtsL
MWGAALVTVASLFTLVSFHVFAAQSAFTLERLSKERTNEQLRYQRLRLQVASLSSAQTVIKASERLGMVPGSHVVTLSVPSAGPVSAVADPISPDTQNDYPKTKRALGPTP